MEELSQKVDCKKLKVSRGSSLVIEGDNIAINGLSLNGALVIRATNGAKVTIKDFHVENKGWEWKPLEENSTAASEEEIMRGFKVVRHETRTIEFNSPGDYVVEV